MSIPSPVPLDGVFTSGATVLNDWVLALAGGQGHLLGNIRCKRGQQDALLLIAIVPRGNPKPSAADPTDDEKYSVGSGDTYPLGEFASAKVDVWVRASDGSAGVTFVAWGLR